MKKNLWMLGMAVAALTSCTQNEVIDVPESRAISLKPFITKTSRAVSELVSDDFEEFYVFGYLDYTNVSTDDFFSNNAVFENNIVEYEENDKGVKVWTSTPIKYWVTDASYRFAAYANGFGTDDVKLETATSDETNHPENSVLYYPYDDTDESSNDGDQLRFYNYTCDGETDLVAAVSGNRVVENVVTNTSIPFEFHHMLSRVRFSFAMTAAPTAGTTMFVEDIYIENAVVKADGICKFVQDPENPNSNLEPDVRWTVVDGAGGVSDVDFTGESVQITGPNYNYVETLVIPQSNSELYVHFKLKSYDSQGKLIDEFPYKASLETPNTTGRYWQNGLIYNYIHTFQANAHQTIPISFTATVDGWSPANSNGIQLILEDATENKNN